MPPPASTPADVVGGCVARFEASEPLVRAWTTFDPERALAQAAALHPRARAGMPLWGVPVGIKDVIDVAGMATTASSRVLAGNLADADAPVVARLRAAGAIVLGKTNTQEFAYGAVSAPTTNPLDPQRIPGGSSGGSAAALAAGHCWGALGTDTAGSIRIPAALCGVVGLKPRPGRLPLQGIIPLAPSFDVVGPMARTVAEVAVLWEVLSGVAVGLGEAAVADLWVAVAPLESLPELEPEVAGAYVDALTELGHLTRPLVRADIPAFEAFDGPRSRVLMSEALAVHRSRGWWPGRREDYTEETRGYLEFAEQSPAAALLSQARAECARLAGGLLALFEHVDALATPTVPCEAPTHAEAAFREEGRPRRPIVMKLTRIPGPVNVAGLAALSVPCGLTKAGLPVGLQLIGKDEAVLLRLGDAFERARG